VATIDQRLREAHGLDASESSLRPFIWPISRRGGPGRGAGAAGHAAAGEEDQVGYGLLGRWFDPASKLASVLRPVWL